MQSTAAIADYLEYALIRNGGEALHRQLYKILREKIKTGVLKSGSPLPSTRSMAEQLQIARNTVLYAYEQLIAEGYLETRQGSGTFVAELSLPKPNPVNTPPHSIPLSNRGKLYSAHNNLPIGLSGAFAPGIPELKQFPHKIWQNLLHQHGLQHQTNWLHYQTAGGYHGLKQNICDYLQLSRSVNCRPEQILIVQGAQQGLELIGRLLADEGDTIWVEDPGYAGANAAFVASSLKIEPVPVDSQGLNPSLLTHPSSPKLIYVTPSHQYPSGVVMSLTRRLELLQLAEQHQSWIIEDDYDGEFRYATDPIASLQGLSQNNRVIYVGTFSKVLYPAIRLAYLVLPEPLIDSFRATYSRFYREGHYIEQVALSHFIEQGHFIRHIKRMKELYRIRQSLLRNTLNQHLGELLPLSNGEAGLHLVATLPDNIHEQELSQEAAKEQLWLRPLSRHFINKPTYQGLVLGYAGVEEQHIYHAALRLVELLSQRLK